VPCAISSKSFLFALEIRMASEILDIKLISEAELARQLDRCLATVERWRKRGIGPAPTMIGKKPMYRIETVRQWLLEQERQPSPRKPGRVTGHTQRGL
jgi:hypothetical protein